MGLPISIKIINYWTANPQTKTAQMLEICKNRFGVEISVRNLRRLKKTPVDDLAGGSKCKAKCKPY